MQQFVLVSNCCINVNYPLDVIRKEDRCTMDLQLISNYIGIIIGIVSIFLSIYFFFKSLESKTPLCHYRTYRGILKLTSQKDSKIKIFFNSEEVDRIFVTYIWFWNGGKRPITRQDIQQKLRIKLIDDKIKALILDYKVIKTSRDAIHFFINKSDNVLDVDFEFLDHKDGVVVEIQHTGGYETKVVIEGVILGAPKGVLVSGGEKKLSQYSLRRYTMQSIPSQFISTKIPQRSILTVIISLFLLLMFYLSFGNVQDTIHQIFQYIYTSILALFLMIILYDIWASGVFPFPRTLHFSSNDQDNNS